MSLGSISTGTKYIVHTKTSDKNERDSSGKALAKAVGYVTKT